MLARDWRRGACRPGRGPRGVRHRARPREDCDEDGGRMSAVEHPPSTKNTQKTGYTGVGVVSGVVVLLGILGGGIAAAVSALALLGTPLFAVMGGLSEVLWLTHRDPEYHHLRYIAANIL